MANYKSKFKGQQIDNLLDFVNNNQNNIAMQSDLPTDVSDLNNDSGFIDNTVNNLVNYYLKSETYTKTEINTLISDAASGGFVKVEALPTENINVKAIYLVPYTGSRTKNLYEEYIYIDGDWEMIGTTKIDLSNYITTEALSTALADYVLTTDLNTLIANYYNKTEIAGLLSNKVDTSTIGQANGVASLDNNGKVPSSQLPEQGGGVSDFNDLTNRPQKEVTSIASLIDPVPLPTHNQVGSVGFTPVGTVISVMGTTAPTHYLACNGQTVNIADYPELAQYFEEQFGSVNNFGGNGTTTFGIPDLRGEFLRGTGTNSHANQGSGGTVGQHQDATEFPTPWIGNDGSNFSWYSADGCTIEIRDNNVVKATNAPRRNVASVNGSATGIKYYATSRPTNTSVLYCIATKNIYLDPRNDYSTDEKVVGTWIDGKPLYQKTVSCGALPNASYKEVAHGISNLGIITHLWGCCTDGSSRSPLPFVGNSVSGNDASVFVKNDVIRITAKADLTAFTESYVTLQYTKTTD